MEINFKIPNNISVLALTAVNRVEERDQFRDDGWVYRTNDDGSTKKVRKWFVPLGHCGMSPVSSIWEPKLDNLPLCEEKFWKANQYFGSQKQNTGTANRNPSR